MNIDPQSVVSSLETSLRAKATTPTNKSDELEKQDFMNLFMTQMSHQDPLKPMDSGAMMTQLAQLGSMEQLQHINGQLKEMNGTQKEISRFQAVNFLDKDVMLDTQQVELSKGSGRPVYYSLDNDVDNVKLTIEDKDGSPVFSKDLGMVTAGRHQYAWDGKNDEGVLMGDGNYNIRLRKTTSDGTSAELDLYKSGRISQVEYRKGQPWVRINDTMLPLSKVSTIDNLSKRLFGGASPLPPMQELAPKPFAQLNIEKPKAY
ncbi:hypothetical protein KJ966_12285 [bacterium]|nr:hypothetical protein [bacterium]